ncbi:MAG: hypothetical protein M1836_004745 [Candelina mexicana]|nr:MAG: hypothetical protein M1836_004745 [Candelina mexicana]
MPPEGSFMYWFLTNRGIHMWITLSTLTSLAIYTFLTNFRLTSPFAHLLPPFSSFLSHPISFMSTWLEVYKLHTAHISAETAERRKRKVDDVVKRSEYRKAHGLDQGEGFGAWTARTEGEALGPAIGGSEVKGVNVVAMGDGTVGNGAEKEEKGVYKDFEGRRRPVKKWFGIW